MASLTWTLIIAALILLFGCVTVPKEPTMLVLPGTGKSLDQFRSDDLGCRQFAGSQVGSTASGRAATGSGAKSVIVGTAQQADAVHVRYDYAYLQCMYAQGHRIPVYLPPPPASQPPPPPH